MPTHIEALATRWSTSLPSAATSSQLYDLAASAGLLPVGIGSEGAHSERIRWGAWLAAQGLQTRTLRGRRYYLCPTATGPDVLVFSALDPQVRASITATADANSITREAATSALIRRPTPRPSQVDHALLDPHVWNRIKSDATDDHVSPEEVISAALCELWGIPRP